MYRIIRAIVLIVVLLALFTVALEKYTAYQKGLFSIPMLGIGPKPLVPETVISGSSPVIIKTFQSHKTLEIRPTVNGITIPGYLDTGSWGISLPLEQAKRLGKPLREFKADESFDYDEYAYGPITVTLGGLTASNLIGTSRSDQNIDKMIVGMDYLEHFDFHFIDGELTLYAPDQLSLDWASEASLISTLDNANRYLITATINETPRQLLFDTGIIRSGIKQSVAIELGLIPHKPETTSGILETLLTSNNERSDINLKLGDLSFDDIVVDIYQQQYSALLNQKGIMIDGLLGQDIIQHLEYAQIDQTLYIRANQKNTAAAE